MPKAIIKPDEEIISFKNDITFNCNSNYIFNLMVILRYILSGGWVLSALLLGDDGIVRPLVEWLLELHAYHLQYFVKFIFRLMWKKSLNICILRSIFILKITCISNKGKKKIYIYISRNVVFLTSFIFIYILCLFSLWMVLLTLFQSVWKIVVHICSSSFML